MEIEKLHFGGEMMNIEALWALIAFWRLGGLAHCEWWIWRVNHYGH